ncbi:MAG: deoxynucleoside kinase [Oscillospiraceae bacterium]|nr:deoxynucleoside kinase [Oscillospiraceae bacterium]
MALIVFEGVDGSGKSTQFRLLSERMTRQGLAFTNIVFPQYDKPSSALLKMYLDGAFGPEPEDVGPHAASTFYAVDRYASYKTVWGDAYRRGEIVLADRYTTSNAVHQGSKLQGEQRQEFFRWLDAFEHGYMELPRPDIVLYMDVPIEVALENLCARQIATNTKADIHETGVAYLRQCADAAEQAAACYGWHRVQCMEGENMRPEAEIHEEIFGILTDMTDLFD